MATDLQFISSVSGSDGQGLVIRGEPIKTLIKDASFVQTLFLSLTGRLPNTGEERLLNAVMVAAIDQGLEPASGFVPRVAISSGVELTTALASAVLMLGPRHGAAVTGAMQIFQQVLDDSVDRETTAGVVVSSYLSQGKRIPGFGHPVFRQSDPRAQTLLSLARRTISDCEALDAALLIEVALEQHLGRHLPLNIDGAIGALLLVLGIDPLAGNGLFAVARMAGAIAHCIEEIKQDKGVRRLPASAVVFED